MSPLPPLTGDAAAMRAERSRQDALVQAIDRALSRMSGGSDAGTSESETALRGRFDEVSGSIETARVRLVDSSEALADYATALEAAQERARQAGLLYDRADQAHEEASRHERRSLDEMQNASPEEQQSHLTDAQRWASDVSLHSSERASAQAEYDAAVADRDSAASVAASRLQGAFSSSFWSDAWDWVTDVWDGFMGWVRDNADILAIIEDIAAQVALWAGIAAGVLALLSLIPVLAPITGPLALIAAGVAGVAAGVSFVLNSLLALSGSGERDIVDVIASGIGLALVFIPGVGAAAGAGIRALFRSGVGRALGRAARRKIGTVVEEITDFLVDRGLDWWQNAPGSSSPAPSPSPSPGPSPVPTPSAAATPPAAGAALPSPSPDRRPAVGPSLPALSIDIQAAGLPSQPVSPLGYARTVGDVVKIQFSRPMAAVPARA